LLTLKIQSGNSAISGKRLGFARLGLRGSGSWLQKTMAHHDGPHCAVVRDDVCDNTGDGASEEPDDLGRKATHQPYSIVV
jgi:hypothetical protein